jgi:hypothetical protein
MSEMLPLPIVTGSAEADTAVSVRRIVAEDPRRLRIATGLLTSAPRLSTRIINGTRGTAVCKQRDLSGTQSQRDAADARAPHAGASAEAAASGSAAAGLDVRSDVLIIERRAEPSLSSGGILVNAAVALNHPDAGFYKILGDYSFPMRIAGPGVAT